MRNQGTRESVLATGSFGPISAKWNIPPFIHLTPDPTETMTDSSEVSLACCWSHSYYMKGHHCNLGRMKSDLGSEDLHFKGSFLESRHLSQSEPGWRDTEQGQIWPEAHRGAGHPAQHGLRACLFFKSRGDFSFPASSSPLSPI